MGTDTGSGGPIGADTETGPVLGKGGERMVGETEIEAVTSTGAGDPDLHWGTEEKQKERKEQPQELGIPSGLKPEPDLY